jgi:hypothetical protein
MGGGVYGRSIHECEQALNRDFPAEQLLPCLNSVDLLNCEQLTVYINLSIMTVIPLPEGILPS